MEQVAYIAMILLIGTLCSVLAYWIKVSNIFFLILAGMVLGGFGLIEMPEAAIHTLAVIALAMIVFDSTKKLKFMEIKKYSVAALKLNLVFFLLEISLISFAAYALFKLNIVIVLLFASMMYGIDPGVSLAVLGKTKAKVAEILEIESLLNTPITVIFPIMILKLISSQQAFTASILQINAMIFFKQIIIGILIGASLGYIIGYVMKNTYFGDLSHVCLFTSAVIAYAFAELLDGSGILSVTLFGLIFGNVHFAHEGELKKSASIIAYTLEILVFILVGTILLVQPEYIFKGTILFVVYLGVRMLSVEIALPSFKFKEKLFMTLNVPKGIDDVALILLITAEFMQIPGMITVINLSLLFVLYSIVLSTITTTITPNLLAAGAKKASHKANIKRI